MGGGGRGGVIAWNKSALWKSDLPLIQKPFVRIGEAEHMFRCLDEDSNLTQIKLMLGGGPWQTPPRGYPEQDPDTPPVPQAPTPFLY